MRVLLSTIGSRGDVQPLVALALALRDRGPDVRLCVPPDFRGWIEGLGFSVTPIGPDLRKAIAASTPTTGTAAALSPERVRQMAEGTVATQFETITAAAQGCDVIVGATALQIAAPSVAERIGIPYVFAAYCPLVLPSPAHAPIPLGMRGEKPWPATADNRELWARDAQRWNETWGPILNAHRASAGLASVNDVRRYILTDRPWLASDPTLGPWPEPANGAVFQTGAWIVPDDRPLSRELETFLDVGEAPIYFGFGSMRAPEDLSRIMVQTARALGRRAIVSRGWAELSLVDGEPDCFAVGEVNQQALFARVAAVVHHGGAGTTATGALAGAPQLIVPQMYDQHYWARRVDDLGIGTAHAATTPTAESLTSALDCVLQTAVADRAKSIASRVLRDGASSAAQRLMTL